MMPIAGKARVHGDAAELARSAADELTSLAEQAIAARGRFTIALTGGSSPVELYRLLGEESTGRKLPWKHIHLFWGDDRVVPPDHPRSNFRLANRLFIHPLGLPQENVHRVRGELEPGRAADAYARELTDFFSGVPRFDLVHLGLGDDGHVASLFPFDRRTLLERNRVAVPALHRPLGEWRVTLTYPVLSAARRIEFLLPSAQKARILRVAMRGPIDPIRIPAQGVRPARGELLWRMTREVEGKCGTATAARPSHIHSLVSHVPRYPSIDA